jgi:hypothetical protein
MITLQAKLRAGQRPQALLREGPVADDIPQDEDAADPHAFGLGQHRLERRQVAMDV